MAKKNVSCTTDLVFKNLTNSGWTCVFAEGVHSSFFESKGFMYVCDYLGINIPEYITYCVISKPWSENQELIVKFREFGNKLSLSFVIRDYDFFD